MKPRLPIIITTTLLTCPAFAQDMEQGIPEHVLEAIREFNQRPPGSPNEVIVVLDPPDGEKSPEPEAREKPNPKDGDGSAEVVPTEERNPATDAPPPAPPADDEAAPRGPEVRVKALRETAASSINAADVRITTPFAAKPIGSPSAGWKLMIAPDAPEFTENVEVSPGTWLTLSIRPHVLVPDADGRGVFQIAEPGFNAASGYRQKATVSSAIATSISQLEEDARVLSQVIDELEQILISLPKSANEMPVTDEIPQ